MKKKTIRKVKIVKETVPLHWTAFDESIWGPTRVRALLDEMLNDVENGDALCLEQLQVEKRIGNSSWDWINNKYSWFREGVELVKRAIYAKRLNLVAYEDKSSALLKELHHFSSSHQDSEFSIEERKKKADHQRKKDFEEHASKLRTQEATVNPMAKVPHLIQGSDGLLYSGFNTQGKTLEEAECALKTYQESMTLNPDGTKSQS